VRAVYVLDVSAPSTPSVAEQRALLEAARGGEDAFRRLVEPHHAALHAHCYRMLGSLHDAEDALQEAMLRAWRALPRFEARSSVRTWLYRIATNTCLDAIARRPKRVLPIDYGPPGPDEPEQRLTETIWIEPYPDEQIGLEDGYASPEARYEQREAVELAFVAALQHLSPRQRAVLILREVLGFSAREVAATLETTVVSVNSALQRARKTVDERLPEQSQQATLRAIGDEQLNEVVQRFMDALENGEVEPILSMLADDATFAMPPFARWWHGREAVADSWLAPSGPAGELRCIATRANGQPAVATYARSQEAGSYLLIALDVLTLEGAQIAGVMAFRTTDAFDAFGLPEAIPAGAATPAVD